MSKGRVMTLETEKKDAKKLAEDLHYTRLCPDIMKKIDAAVDSHQISRILADARIIDDPLARQNIQRRLKKFVVYDLKKEPAPTSQKRNELRDVFAAYGYAV